jgi:plasmid stabilization system protein ParE
MRIQIRRLARRDIDEAFDWYRESDEETASGFLDELAHVFDRLLLQPSQFPDVHRGVRRALLKRFPYAIYFRTHGDIATVIGVGQRQAPSRWKSRR